MLKDELGRLNCLGQSARRFQNLYDIIINTEPGKAAAFWIDDEGKECSRSFRQFDVDIRAAAALFRRRIGEENEGHFIALMMENRYHWSVAFWGLLMAGYKPILIDVNQKEAMVEHLLFASGTVAIVGKTEQESPVTLIRTEELADAQPEASFVPRFADELALCTSGTTSTSKVFVFGEDAIVRQALGVIPKITECPRLVQDGKDPVRHLAFLPMHHILGFMVHCILFPLVGKTVVYIKDRAPLTIQEACKRFRVTNLIVVPLLLNNLANGLWKKVRQEGRVKLCVLKTLFALSNAIQRLYSKRGPDIAAGLLKSIQRRLLGDAIRTILVGGSHIPLKTLKIINGLGYYPMPGFGMTETGLTSFETRPQACYRLSGSTTKVEGIEYKTVDTDDNPSDVGELLIRGGTLHKARLIDGERQAPEYGADGWFRSGDIARIKKGGLYIEGRLKEVIINESGENVYPDELEDVFDAVPGIERLCVLSLANSTPYEDISLVFQLPDNNVDPQAVAAVAAEISALNAKQPVLRRIRRLFVAAQPLPLANGIKVRRQKLKEWVETGEIDVRPVDLQTGVTGKAMDGIIVCYDKVTTPNSTEEEAMNEIRAAVIQCFAAVLTLSATQIGVRKHFFDELGGDSLDGLNLLARVETTFGLIIDEREFRECANVEDVARLIWRKRTGQANIPTPLARAETNPITNFTESREYLTFQERLKGMAHVANPYFICHDSILKDVSLVNGREVLNFASYNYICMSGHPETVRAACEAAERYGTSASGSRLLAGEKELYCELEKEIAAWKHTENALVFVSGHATNVTFVGNFCNERDLILYDALSHNSILQGCALSRATCRAFPHNDVKALEDILKMSRGVFEKVLLVVEGVYSMDGDIAPINEFVRLKKKYGLFLMVDEAHSACVIGENGGGVHEHFGLQPTDIDIKMGTLSKGIGACGGYLAGSTALMEYLRYNLPGFVFSVGISPPVAAAALTAIRILRQDHSPVAVLRKNITYFVNAARLANLNICLAGETAIIPILVGNEADAFLLSEMLLKRGISVPPAVYPAVSMGKARLRFCVTSSHKEEQIDFAITQLREVASEAGIELPKREG
ncbi:MAG: aminotransferase class I/II-fold pyridoxal phosphate-dependent enzyme [Prevotellaceae bacterium]|jgi:8-amino-7-oxononanoate synthase/acyl carrier protein|nr:aminotransferase class I/II-fold pyridoxal phosphate-dependent enzyme [Prevotellaceae bacterium]